MFDPAARAQGACRRDAATVPLMNTPKPAAGGPFASELPDFSLVLGGPLFQLLRRSHLSGDALELLHRRILFILFFAWLPLLLLSLIGGHALVGAISASFLRDIEVQTRFLIALPVLIAAELIVHLRIRSAVLQFVERSMVVPEVMPKFRAAIDSAMRLRNSIGLEAGLLVLVYTLGLWIWWSQIALSEATWYATPQGGQLHLTPAGYWYVFVSVPFFQFILMRWYWRVFIWFRFLWQVSRLNLNLIPTHPDRAGGLGFLGKAALAFGPLLFAQGALLSGIIATQILVEGKNLLSFKVQIAGFVAFLVLFALAPLGVFTPLLLRAKRRGLDLYGVLASRYVQEFEGKWIRGGTAKGEELLGSGDFQSLADLGNSYVIIQEMRAVPFGLRDVTPLVVASLSPLLPLLLTIFSFEELVLRLFKILF
jgi:hypothetical protein